MRGRRKRVERHVLLAHPRTRKNLFQNKKTQNKTEKTKRLTDSDVVVLGEDPPVKVGRDVVADVHLRQVAVVGHLVLGDADALLEGDGVVVLARADLLGDAAVGAVGAEHDVDVERLRDADLAALVVVVVVDRERAVGAVSLRFFLFFFGFFGGGKRGEYFVCATRDQGRARARRAATTHLKQQTTNNKTPPSKLLPAHRAAPCAS